MGSNSEAPGSGLCLSLLTVNMRSQKGISTFNKLNKNKQSNKKTNPNQPTNKKSQRELPHVFPHGSYHSVTMTLNKNASTSKTEKAIMSKSHIYSDRQHLCRTMKPMEENALLPSEQSLGHKQGPANFIWIFSLLFKTKGCWAQLQQFLSKSNTALLHEMFLNTEKTNL